MLESCENMQGHLSIDDAAEQWSMDDAAEEWRQLTGPTEETLAFGAEVGQNWPELAEGVAWSSADFGDKIDFGSNNFVGYIDDAPRKLADGWSLSDDCQFAVRLLCT